jgi:hypothetical protein
MLVNPDQFWGANDVDALFKGGIKTPVPFDSATRLKKRASYDPSIVQDALIRERRVPGTGVEDVDPRILRATQPSVLRPGVMHYMSGDYERTGRTYADQGKLGNDVPVVYRRNDPERNTSQAVLLSGHHRATAALLRGQPLRAIVVDGPWGPERGR